MKSKPIKWFIGLKLASLWLCIGLVLPVTGQQEASSKPPVTGTTAPPPLKQISESVFEIGKVRFDKLARTITIPAEVNMDQGLIEYLLVHSSGKVHESVFRTEAEPYHIHLAVLFLSESAPRVDAREAGTSSKGLARREVLIAVKSTLNGQEAAGRAEDYVLNVQTKQPMTPGPWVYSGSRTVDGTFLAQRDGSIIAVIDDLDALVHNSRPGSENDENWQVNGAKRPVIGSAVQMIIHLDHPKKTKNE